MSETSPPTMPENPKAMTDTEIDTALVTAAFSLAALDGWIQVSVADAAREANIPLDRARARMPGRHAILRGFGRMADVEALAEVPTEGSTREKLFDLLMRRIDVHQAHRDGIVSVLDTLFIDPVTALLLNSLTRTSMRWMLDAAGVARGGRLGLISDELRVSGMVVVWLWTIRAWRQDDSPDLSGTMRALDAALIRAENAGAWMAAGTPAPAGDPLVGEPPVGEQPTGPITPDVPPADAGFIEPSPEPMPKPLGPDTAAD